MQAKINQILPDFAIIESFSDLKHPIIDFGQDIFQVFVKVVLILFLNRVRFRRTVKTAFVSDSELI